MKKLIIAAAALGLCVQVAFSQGTVNFINSGAFSVIADRLVYSDQVGGTRLVGTNYVAILYWGRTSDAINTYAVRAAGDESYARAYAAFRDVLPTSSAAGTWAGGPRTFIGANTGDQLWLQVRVWDLSKGATFEEGRQGGLFGQSDPFRYTVAAPTDAAGLKINEMRAFALVPEPSTIALGVLGLGSLLLFRRKKA